MKARLLYIDNLRWVMIMLVVSMHAAVTYSHLGSWYYMEDRVVSAPETALFGTYQATLQSFFMGFLFFIAGYFVPGAYDTKGPGKFIRDRAYRLGLPLLFFVFILQPVAIYCIGLFHGEDVAPDGFTGLYRWYIRSGHWLGGTGPLWFCEALLIFCLGYMVFRMLARPIATAAVPHAPATTPAIARPHATSAPGKALIWAVIILIAVLTFLVRFPWPNGTSFYNLQFCYFSQYVLYFAAGTLAFRGGWLSRFSTADGKYWGRVALIGGLLFWAALLVLGGATKGALPAYKGGMHWQSLGMAFWESMTGTAISLYLLVMFREKFNRQGSAARFFSANAFAVYVFHTPILIAISRLVSPVQAPLLLKFLFLTFISLVVSYALCSLLFRKLPLLRRIL
jgi:fucose 4-O-acetylase-like acetyltransferase